MIITPTIEICLHENHPFVVYANAVDGDVLGRFDSGDDVRLFLYDHSRFDDGDLVVLRDADGNGSDCTIPIEWIGDGEPLVASRRVLDRIA
jgi:hypothetical protein